MDRAGLLDALRRNGARVADLADGDLSAAVTSCDGWSLGDLVRHLGAVYAMASGVVDADAAAVPDPSAEGGDREVAAWFRAAWTTLVEVLDAADPDLECWNWTPAPQTAAFWVRRMANETAVHRWDAETAMGEPSPIDSALAADGIDEWFDVHARTAIAGADGSASVGSLHVHCTDVDGEWWADIEDGVLALDRTHRKGDAVIRGDASTVLLLLWGRGSLDSVEIFGEVDIVSSWLGYGQS